MNNDSNNDQNGNTINGLARIEENDDENGPSANLTSFMAEFNLLRSLRGKKEYVNDTVIKMEKVKINKYKEINSRKSSISAQFDMNDLKSSLQFNEQQHAE